MADTVDNQVVPEDIKNSTPPLPKMLDGDFRNVSKDKCLQSSSFGKLIAVHDVCTNSIAEADTVTAVDSSSSLFSLKSEEQFLEHACRQYQSLSVVGDIISGQILEVNEDSNSTICNILTTLSQRDLERNEKRNYQKFTNVNINWSTAKVNSNDLPFPAENNEIVLQSFSNDSKLKAVIKKSTKTDKDIFYLEIWSGRGLEKNYNLSATKKHGDIYNDATFSSLQWSNDCSKLLLIAEKINEGNKSYFDRETDSSLNDSNAQQSILRKGNKFVYAEDFGEQKRKMSQSVIVIIDVNSGDVEVADGIPEYICPGQDGGKSLFLLDLYTVKTEDQLSDVGCAPHSPRVTPDEKQLVYLERDEGGPHRGCERLMLLDIESRKKPSVLYDIVQNATEKHIPLYCYSLAKRCWLSNGKYLILHTIFRSDQILVLIEIATGKLQRITDGGGFIIL